MANSNLEKILNIFFLFSIHAKPLAVTLSQNKSFPALACPQIGVYKTQFITIPAFYLKLHQRPEAQTSPELNPLCQSRINKQLLGHFLFVRATATPTLKKCRKETCTCFTDVPFPVLQDLGQRQKELRATHCQCATVLYRLLLELLHALVTEIMYDRFALLI